MAVYYFSMPIPKANFSLWNVCLSDQCVVITNPTDELSVFYVRSLVDEKQQKYSIATEINRVNEHTQLKAISEVCLYILKSALEVHTWHRIFIHIKTYFCLTDLTPP